MASDEDVPAPAHASASPGADPERRSAQALLAVLALGTEQAERGRTRPMRQAIEELRRRLTRGG